MKNRKIPSLIAIALLFLGTIAGTTLIQRGQSVSTQASAVAQPRDVLVSNVTDTSFTVTWRTDEPTAGFVQWGEGNSTNTPAHGAGGELKTVHSIKVMGLKPATQYSFVINSGSERHSDSSAPWSVTTGPTLPLPESSRVLSGIIQADDTTPAKQALVVVSAPEMSPLTAVTSSSGTWVIPVSLARSTENSTYATLDEKLVSIQVYGSKGAATAVLNGSQLSVVPTIVLGQAYDFTTQLVPETESEPETSDVQGITSANVVTLESVENGEVVFTDVPEFFGSGPAGREISITVHSDPVSGDTQVEEDGTWAWSPPTNLENGLHNITIEWIDLQGVVHTLTRSFIVQAQENEPSFESTPSGTTSPTPSATATATATPRPSATATARPTATATTKPAELPDAGSAMPSLLLATAGFVTLSLGAIFALKK